jgi:hypothetical protein
MLTRLLQQRHIILDSGRTTLALEKEYWQVMERFAEDDGWSTWRDWFYMNVLPEKPDDIPFIKPREENDHRMPVFGKR